MSFRMKLILVVLLLSQYNSYSQKKQPQFFEIIKGDSVKLFFNRKYHLTEKKCKDYTRLIKVDEKGNYNGSFEDYSNENLLLGKGKYVNGRKEGYFEIYYPNGKLECKGNYLNNRPVGVWEFFYENEFPERTLKFTETDTLLISFFDKRGKLKVTDGQGEFNGFVAGLTKPSTAIIARGNIIGGKPNGKWTSTYSNNEVFCKEEFDHGKLIRGKFPNAVFDKNYTNKSFLNTLLLETYTYKLELFVFDDCPDSSAVDNYKPFDIQVFSSVLKSKIEDIIKNDFRNDKTEDYGAGDHYITIQFDVNKEGKAENFSMISFWGQQFYYPISTSIKMYTNFQKYPRTLFFHLKIHFSESLFYNYSFQFSDNKIFN